MEFKIYKKLLSFNNKKANSPMKNKCESDQKRHFTKEFIKWK